MSEFVTGLGVGLFAVGFVIFSIGIVARMKYVRRSLDPASLPLWFRAEGLVLLGGSALYLGPLLAGILPWLVAIAVAILAVAAFIFLRAGADT